MKRTAKKLFAPKLLVLMLALLALSCTAAAEDGFTAEISVARGTAVIRSTELDGESWLFLPAFAAERKMELIRNGRSVEWQEIGSEDGVSVWQTDAGETLRVMRSENLRALFLFSDDPQTQGRAYLDNAPDHENYASGSVALIDTNGRVDFTGEISKIRGRGNFTWQLDKKAYQFKLTEKADLLKTGVKEERNRTWILLADGFDGTLLHNRVTLDLALELGLENTSRSEHVDLYYDGEYRGLYLLTEKVEAGEGRLEVDEYDDLIESWNKAAGQYDLDALPVGEGENRFGSTFTYIEGLLETGEPNVGSFVLEMESEQGTLSDRCWFRLSDGSVLACESPSNASEAMMRYISERLQEARNTLQNGGVNPENGRTIEEDFDLTAFAKHMLLAELSNNADTYRYSSTWFVLPAGSTRFEPGTVWDFDLAYRYRRNGENAEGMGLRDQSGWMAEFYRCPAFVEEMQRVYAEELLPIVQRILLGEETGRYLKPLDDYIEEIAASRRMNDRLWDWVEYSLFNYGSTVEEEYAIFRQFLTERSAWLESALLSARPDADRVDLWAYAAYLRVGETVTLHPCPWNHVRVAEYTWEKCSEATETDYAVWKLEAVLEAEEGYAFSNPTVVLNGTELAYERREDGTLRICVTFEDPSYRPVDYDGEDIGRVFNPDFYAERYPDIAAQYADDPQGLTAYFCEVGMEEGQQGNAFFKPDRILQTNAELEAVLGEDWFLYYWDFIDFGCEEGWLENGGWGFRLTVRDAL